MIALEPDLEYRAMAAALLRRSQDMHRAAMRLPQGSERRRQSNIAFDLEKASRHLTAAAAGIRAGEQSS